MGDTFNNKAFDNVAQQVPTEKVNYKGQFRIIGEVIESKLNPTVIGYVLMRETDFMIKMFSIPQVISLLQREYKFVNAKLVNDNEIVNTELTANNMNRLPKFDRNMQIVENAGITILGEIYAKSKLVGYRILDTNCQKQDIMESDLVILATKAPLINAKVVTKNEKPYVASLKGEFTVIEKADVAKLRKESEEKKKAKLYRNKAHADKLENLIKHAMIYAFGLDSSAYNHYDYGVSTFELGGRSYSYYDWNRDIHILAKEVLTTKKGYNLTDKDKALFKKLVAEVPHLDYIGWKQDDKALKPYRIEFDETHTREQQEYYVMCLSQFVLTNEEKYNAIANQITNYYFKPTGSWRDAYRLNPKQLIKIDDRAGKLIKNQHATTYFKNLYAEVVRQLDALATKEMAKKADYKHKQEVKALGRKPFNVTTFKSADDIAQLGLAITKQNDGIKYTTRDGRIRKLFFIGKQFDKETTYQRYLNLSTCLGDIMSVAALHKIRTRYEKNTDYLDGGWGDRSSSRVSRAVICMEMLIIIAYIYGSKAMKKYVEDNEEELNALQVRVPNFEELSTTDYHLDKAIKIYYESGFNVFLYDGSSLSHLELPSEYREYRHCGYSKSIQHPLLQGDLASTINIIIDNRVDPEDVSENVGRLRFM